MSIISQRIREVRNEKNITSAELGRALGVSGSTITRYENGQIEKVPVNVVGEIAEFLNVSPAYLMGWTNVRGVITTRIPVLGKIACGSPIMAEENIEEYKERSTEGLPSGDLFYLQAQGSSMSPAIVDGSYVLIKQQEDVENGEIAAVLVNGDEEATLKRVRKADGFVILESINEEYENYLVDRHNPAKIIGKAVEVVNKL